MGVLSSESIGKVGESPAQGLANKCVFVVAVIVRGSSGGQAGFWGGGAWRKNKYELGHLPLILCFLSVSLQLLFNVIVY